MTLRRSTAGRPTVAIIGGGVSGATTALFLSQRAAAAFRIIVIEPRAQVGRGLAYSSDDPAHRINVPAPRMEIHADDPEHFIRWLSASQIARLDPDATLPDGRLFPSRQAFGSYIHDQVAAAEDILHVRGHADGVTRGADRYQVSCRDGAVIDADIVVIAVCHPAPTVPASLRMLETSRIVADPWAPQALDAIAPDERLLIVGTGLTMADIVATLDRRGHRGDILAISRRGQRSQAHTMQPAEPYGDFLSPPSVTALALLRRIRSTVAHAGADNLSWHPVLDQVRLQGSEIWRALPAGERQRLLRYLRPFWDTHRFRLAPQVHEVLERRIGNGRLTLQAAGIQSVTQASDHLHVVLRARRSGALVTRPIDRIVLATGPAHGSLFRDDPLLRQLQQQGLAHADIYGLGVEVDRDSRVIDAHGTSQQRFFVAGPLARGTFGELMGVPDVVAQTARIAETIAADFAADALRSPRKTVRS